MKVVNASVNSYGATRQLSESCRWRTVYISLSRPTHNTHTHTRSLVVVPLTILFGRVDVVEQKKWFASAIYDAFFFASVFFLLSSNFIEKVSSNALFVFCFVIFFLLLLLSVWSNDA